jgi:hypothetical protein
MADAGNSITVWAVFSAIGGSIVGSVVGGAISYWLQNKNLAAIGAQRAEDRFEGRKALAYSLFIKMGKVFSNLNLVRKTMQQSYLDGKAAGLKEPWMYVKGFAASLSHVNFSTEEMALILSIDAPLFNDMMPWDAIHNGVIDVFEFYGRRRAELLDRMPATMTGDIGRTTFTAEQLMSIAPRAAELNGIIESLRAQTISDSEEAWKLNERMFALVKKEFGLNRTLQRKPD